MALLRTEAEKLSNNTLLAGVITEILTRDAMLNLLPFQHVNSKALLYTRENTLASGAFLDPNEAVPESASTFTEVVAKLRILAGDVDVDKFLAITMSDTNSQVATQLAAKAKGLARQFAQTIAIGNATANPKEFDGLPQFVVGGQTITAGANGAAVTFDMLDQLKDLVVLGADAFIMRSGTWRAIRALLRSFGGNTAQHIQIPNFGVQVPAIDGMPVLINDFLPGDEVQGGSSATCSIYAVRFNEVDGFHGLYGGSTAGFQFEEIGTVQNKDATRYRLKWYCGTALKSTKSVARLKGITNI